MNIEQKRNSQPARIFQNDINRNEIPSRQQHEAALNSKNSFKSELEKESDVTFKYTSQQNFEQNELNSGINDSQPVDQAY